LVKKETVMGSIGNTQGVKTAAIPNKKAKSIKEINDSSLVE